MSRYRKIEVRTWSDERFRNLSAMPPSGQGLWFFLLTGPHTGPIPGLFRAGRAAMAEELDWDQEDFDKAFTEVSEQGMAKADFKARLVWLPKAIRYNKPESPNVVRGWRVELDLLPECDLKREAIEAIREALSDAGPSYVEAFEEVLSGKGKATSKADEEPSAKPSAKTMLNQEQEQEQEQEKEDTSPSASVVSLPADRLPPCQLQAVVDLYNQTLPELPSVRLLTDKRRKAIGAFWRWVLTSKKSNGQARASTSTETLAWIGDYFARARDNDFLMGRTPRNGEHAGWQCDFDFLLTDKGKTQVIEKARVAA